MKSSQKSNRYSFLVVWPDGTEPPDGCPRSYRVYYPTAEAADLAARGFELEGAETGPAVHF